ncbi:polysaccharide deacetylase family protein [Campylobacter sp. CCUG 57310]|uniref:polysaccharide deacetylase family protein n=1 Tax=Campylobacter sp. CCUG 57310 TaxID=2517362 RepID=UPI0015647BF8|nr:polysaccharide deacetylase family protein [Campylobacter sp. CCUG 57310]QKF91698.1 polysaccharide deacetylase [Campylobacter sp. CCUG 57310]
MTHPVCILTMHHCAPIKDDLTITPELFEKTLQEICNMGFKFINYREFKDILFERKNPRRKSVLLTFDDGYFDNYKFAFPILKELQIPAVCFLITDNISKFKRQNFDFTLKPHFKIDYKEDLEHFLTLDEIYEMRDSGLFEFDSHTATHFSCKNNDEARIKNELERSQEKIKEIFPNKKEFGFCWPKGHFNETSMGLIKKSKYDFAFSVIDGGYCVGDDKFKIRRIDISNNSKDDKTYIFRVKKKLKIYSTPIIGNLYSNFRNRKFK